MTRLLIRNGRLVDPSQGIDGGMDLLIEDGRVAACEERLDAPHDAEILDAGGQVVAPGFIDLHVHLGEPGLEYRETVATACRAAVAGGFTAVCASPDTLPATDDPAMVRFVTERAEAVGLARVYPVGALSRGLDGAELAEMGEMVREGAVAIGDDGRAVANGLLMRRGLEYARSFGVAVMVHAETPDLADGGVMHEGAVSTRIGLRGNPSSAEVAAVARDLVLTELTGGRLHLSRLSTSRALESVRAAKRQGLAVTCDVTAHHLALVDEDVASGSYHPDWKTTPPLRSVGDRAAIRAAIADGTVDAICSDHRSIHADEKERDFSEAPAGIAGIETAVGVAIDELIYGEIIDVMRLVRLFSTGPAQALGLPGGTLEVGAVADVTVLDLRARWTVDPARFSSRCRNTPFAGRTLKGAPAATVVGGKVVWHSS